MLDRFGQPVPASVSLKKQDPNRTMQVEIPWKSTKWQEWMESEYAGCGNDVTTPEVLAGRYHILQSIGRGENPVYKAIEIKTGQMVVIRYVRTDLVKAFKSYELFTHEARNLKKLNIPGVARFYEAVEFLENELPRAYVIRDYIEGCSIYARLRQGEYFTIARIFDISLQILTTLQKLHVRNPPIVHRSLIPSSIMLSTINGRDKVQIVDFGAVINPGGVDDPQLKTHLGYVAPEGMEGRYEPASDIYSLAAIVVFMLCGVSPDEMERDGNRLAFESYLESYPDSISRILGRMLAPERKNRLVDYNEIREHFTNFREGKFALPGDFEVENQYFTSCEYKTHVKTVSNLGACGNLSLWLALPEKTPRKLRDVMDGLDIEEQERRGKMNQIKHALADISPEVRLFIAVISLLFVLLMVYALIASSHKLVPLVVAIVFLASVFYFAGPIVFPGRLPWGKKPRSLVGLKECRNLLIFGQKAIATVVGINYKPSLNVNDDTATRIGRRLDPTRYEIVYRFNTPGDTLEKDLEHSIIVHSDPTETLQLGDPLTILYAVSFYDNDEVLSMPFPFVLGDVREYREIICCTKDGNIQTNYQFQF